MCLVFELSIADLALSSAMTELSVIVFFQKSLLTHVLKSFVHPASGTTIVSSIAVEELLNGELGELFVAPCNVQKGLGGCSCTKSPASSTTRLVVWAGDFSFGVPVFVIR